MAWKGLLDLATAGAFIAMVGTGDPQLVAVFIITLSITAHNHGFFQKRRPNVPPDKPRGKHGS